MDCIVAGFCSSRSNFICKSKADGSGAKLHFPVYWRNLVVVVFPAVSMAGFAFFHFEERLLAFINQRKTISGILFTLILVLVLYFGKQGFTITTDLPSYYHHTFWFSMWAFGIVILWSVFWQLILNKFPKTYAGNFFMWLGKNITVFYIIQWLIIGNIATAIYQTQSINSYIFWFALIFTSTVLLTWLLAKTIVKLVR
jgi:hypothetical protein